MTAQDALHYVKDRWEDFVNLYPQILDLQHRAAVQAYNAKEAGDFDTYNAARESISDLAALAQLHQKALADFSYLRAFVPGLGQVVSLIWAGAVVALAGLVAFIFARFGAEQHVVNLLEQGKVTPEQAAAILAQTDRGGSLSAVSSTVKWAVAGLLGWWAFSGFKLGLERW